MAIINARLWRAIREAGFGGSAVAASPHEIFFDDWDTEDKASSNVTDNKVPPKVPLKVPSKVPEKKKTEKQPEKQLIVSREKAETFSGKEESLLNNLQTSPKKIDENQLDTTTQGRNVLARTGDDIEISLANEGWLFLGYSI